MFVCSQAVAKSDFGEIRGDERVLTTTSIRPMSISDAGRCRIGLKAMGPRSDEESVARSRRHFGERDQRMVPAFSRTSHRRIASRKDAGRRY